VVANAVHKLNAPVELGIVNVKILDKKGSFYGTSVDEVIGLDDDEVGIRIDEPGWGEHGFSDGQLSVLREGFSLQLREVGTESLSVERRSTTWDSFTPGHDPPVRTRLKTPLKTALSCA
jgi:hypothetical protein